MKVSNSINLRCPQQPSFMTMNFLVSLLCSHYYCTIQVSKIFIYSVGRLSSSDEGDNYFDPCMLVQPGFQKIVKPTGINCDVAAFCYRRIIMLMWIVSLNRSGMLG